jgi:hypothetical protein
MAEGPVIAVASAIGIAQSITFDYGVCVVQGLPTFMARPVAAHALACSFVSYCVAVLCLAYEGRRRRMGRSLKRAHRSAGGSVGPALLFVIALLNAIPASILWEFGMVSAWHAILIWIGLVLIAMVPPFLSAGPDGFWRALVRRSRIHRLSMARPVIGAPVMATVTRAALAVVLSICLAGVLGRLAAVGQKNHFVLVSDPSWVLVRELEGSLVLSRIDTARSRYVGEVRLASPDDEALAAGFACKRLGKLGAADLWRDD